MRLSIKRESVIRVTDKSKDTKEKEKSYMKKKISIVLLCVFVMVFMSACAKECRGGCGRKASPDCGAGMCDDCCDYYDGLNGCRHTEFV